MIRAPSVHVVPHSEGWATRYEGAAKIAQTFKDKCEALDWARQYAKATNARVFIHVAGSRRAPSGLAEGKPG